MAISFHTPCVQPPDLWDTISFPKGGEEFSFSKGGGVGNLPFVKGDLEGFCNRVQHAFDVVLEG
jgi:hypothetical protein